MDSPDTNRHQTIKRRTWVQLVAILGGTILYIVFFLRFEGTVGLAVAHIIVLPVIMAGLSFGAGAGLAAGVTAIVINAILYSVTQGGGWTSWIYSSWAGNLMVILTGYIAGQLKQGFDERARAMANLHASENRYRAIVEEQTELICRMLPDGRITFVNQSYLNFFGMTLKDAIGSGVAKRGVDGQSEMIKSSIAMLGPDRPITSFEEYLSLPDGDKRWVHWVYKAIVEDGIIIEIQAIGRDVTKRKRAEEELLEQEMRISSFFHNAAEAIIFLDESQHIQSFSKSAEQIFGYSAGEVIGQPLDLLIPPRFAQAHHLHVQKFASAPENSRSMTNRSEIYGLHKDGREFPAEASITKLLSKNKLTFAVFLHDITERKRAENELRARERFLSLLNDMTHSIIASTDFNSMMKTLVNDLANLLEADHCYVTRWDATKNLTVPIVSSKTAPLHYNDKIDLTMSVLQEGRIFAVEDVTSSPYIDTDAAKAMPEKSLIGIPLIVGEHKLGAALVGYETRHAFTREEIQRAEQAGNQIAIALWNAQQDFETRQRLRETDALAKIAIILSETESIGLSNVLQLIVDFAKDLILGAEQAVIHLIDKERQLLIPEAVSGLEDSFERHTNMRLDEGVAGESIASGKTINIPDVDADPRFIKRSGTTRLRSLMVTPLQSGGEMLGAISVQSNTPNVFVADDGKLLSALGTQAAIAIENAHLIEDTKQALKETNALYRVTQGVAHSLDPNEVLKDTVELLQKNFGYYHVQIYVMDPETGDFVMREGSGEIGRQLKEQGYRLSAGEGIVGYTAETGAAFFANDVDEIVSFVRNPLLPDTKSELAMPVKIDGEILGLLDVQQIPPKRLSQRDIQLVSAVADQLAIALQKANLYRELEISLQQEKAIRNQLVQNERLTVMGRLLASVSHELNNPLQAIQNALFLLKEERDISQQGRQDLNIVLAEAERMASMIERLRTTYRPIQAEDYRSTQINSIIEDVYALIATHLRHNQVAFEFHPDPDLPPIPALTDQIRQVTLNLLMNAVEAMPNGGTLSVCTKLEPEKQEILVTISDTGKGIDPAILPNIFEAFVTDKERGTGLGLTITYDIIAKHRGRISGENNPDKGATFKVWLPIENGEIA